MPDEVPHKRQRVSKACDTCRKKKVKCDGVQPRCGNCTTFNVDCTYNDTTKKRGPPKGYIEAIETRLHRMESLLGGLVQSNDPRAEAVLAQLIQDDDMIVPNRRPTTGRPDYSAWRNNNASNLSSTSSNSARNKDDSSSSLDPLTTSDGKPIEDLNDVMGVLSIDENNQVRYHGRSSGLYLLKKDNKEGVLRVQNQGVWLSGKVVASTNEFELLKHPELTELPSQEIFDHLLEIYFTHVHPIMPIIYKPSFFNRLRDKDTFPHLLLNSMLALASRYSDNAEIQKYPDKPESVGSVFFERAKALLDFEYDHPRVSTVQALILLALREYGSGKVSRAWMYAGMSTRMAQDLGLHRNTEEWDPINFSHEDKETRKRVFWGCFILDRISSANIGRPLAIDEQDVDVSYPSEQEEDENELLPFKMDYSVSAISSPISSNNTTTSTTTTRVKEPQYKSYCVSRFNALAKLCEITGRILHKIYAIRSTTKSNKESKESILSILDSSLTSWLITLPANLQYNPAADEPPAPATITLHIMYYSIIMLLHRPYLPNAKQSFKKHTSAANSLTELAEILVKQGTMKYTMNSTVYAIFMAGVLHTYNATQSDISISQPAKTNLIKCIKALEALKKTWVNAYKYTDLLLELAEIKNVNIETSYSTNNGETLEERGNRTQQSQSQN
ncbi:13309_t:CDS:2, partial [Ambispora leptoticha]